MKGYVIYRGDPKLKDEAIKRAVGHRKADALRKGFYASVETIRDADYNEKGEKFMGCAVGCLATAVGSTSVSAARSPHMKLQRALGIPVYLGEIADGMFESHDAQEVPGSEGYRRPTRAGREWPEKFVRMLPVGLTLTEELQDELSEVRWNHATTDGGKSLGAAKRKLRTTLDRHARKQGVAA